MESLKQKIQESLLSNTRNLGKNRNLDKITGIKKSLDDSALLTSLVKSCTEINSGNIEIIASSDKILFYKEEFTRSEHIKIDFNKWSLYKLPKYIQVANDKNNTNNTTNVKWTPSIIVQSKSGKVDGFTFDFWSEYELLLVSNYKTRFTNCNFLSGFQFGFADDVYWNDKYYKLTSTKADGYMNFDYEIDFEGDGNPAELIKTDSKSGNKFSYIDKSKALINFKYKPKSGHMVNFTNICNYLHNKYGKKQGNLPIKFDYMS